MTTPFCIHGNSSIGFEEFLELMAGKEGIRDDRNGREEIYEVFRLFDVEGKGSITVKDVTRVAKELGKRLTADEIVEIVRRAVTDEGSSQEITPE